MRKLLYAVAIVLLASCTEAKSDVEIITDFYKAVLGETEMTDELLKESLSPNLLDALWEADYKNTYSWWNFRTGYQDGPSQESSLESIEPMGEGWYQVTYSDMGIHGMTDVKMEGGKIADYRPFLIPFDMAQGYFLRKDCNDVCPLKISSQEELLQFFGMASVMGEGGKPTAIDFEKSFVIPIIYPETDLATSIVIDRFCHTGPTELSLAVSTIRGEEHRSFTIRPIELLVVDNYYRNFTIDLQLSD